MQLDMQGDMLLIVSERGMGKCTMMDEFTVQNRGGKGVKCYKITEKTGNIIGVKAVRDHNEIMMITTEGIIIRMPVKGISVLSRVTSGVKLMNLEDDVSVASLTKVSENVSDAGTEEQQEEQQEEKREVYDETAAAESADHLPQQLQDLLERAESDQSEED